MSKDYYNILGVNKNASKDEIKRLFISWPINIIPTKKKAMRLNLKRSTKLTRSYPTIPKGRSMISLVPIFPQVAGRLPAGEDFPIKVGLIFPVFPPEADRQMVWNLILET